MHRENQRLIVTLRDIVEHDLTFLDSDESCDEFTTNVTVKELKTSKNNERVYGHVDFDTANGLCSLLVIHQQQNVWSIKGIVGELT